MKETTWGMCYIKKISDIMLVVLMLLLLVMY